MVSGAELLKTFNSASKSGSSSLLVSMLTKISMPKTVTAVRSAEIRSQIKLTIAKARSANTNIISQVMLCGGRLWLGQRGWADWIILFFIAGPKVEGYCKNCKRKTHIDYFHDDTTENLIVQRV